MATQGIHHITAVAGDPQRNYQFYAKLMGLRLVKKTVNFDDPTVYHLYYGDESGQPGTILTFFPWEHLQSGQPDRGQAVAVSFSVPTGSKEFWSAYLEEEDINFEPVFERFDKEIIGFQDPDGLHLELVFDPKADSIDGWSDGPIPAEHAIRGIYGVTLAEKSYQSTGRLLEEDLGFKLTNQLGHRFLYETEADFGSVVEIIDQFEPNGQPGRGTVHHVAFRSEDEAHQQSIRKRLMEKGYYLTEVKNRGYFKSVYFHEPGGVLFEIATDPPGFMKDEDFDSLGTALKLPQWLEEQRHRIEAELTSLTY